MAIIVQIDAAAAVSRPKSVSEVINLRLSRSCHRVNKGKNIILATASENPFSHKIQTHKRKAIRCGGKPCSGRKYPDYALASLALAMHATGRSDTTQSSGSCYIQVKLHSIPLATENKIIILATASENPLFHKLKTHKRKAIRCGGKPCSGRKYPDYSLALAIYATGRSDTTESSGSCYIEVKRHSIPLATENKTIILATASENHFFHKLKTI
jgi:hypothetical protein